MIGVGAAGVPNLSPGVLPSLLPPDGTFGMSRVEGDFRALPMAMLSKGSLLSFFSEKMVQTTGLEGNQGGQLTKVCLIKISTCLEGSSSASRHFSLNLKGSAESGEKND